MKLIIAGSRDFHDYELLIKEVDNFIGVHCITILDSPVEIISGMARGADMLGYRYARDTGYYCYKMPADWDKFGKSAGYRRNEEMAKIATHCIVFRIGGNSSKGSTHMINLAKEYGLVLRVVDL